MPKITFAAADGTRETVEVPVGTSIMQGAVAAGIDGIVAECGGNAMCATCHVYIDASYAELLPPISTVEDEMLECTIAQRQQTSRLSCRLAATDELDGLHVDLPAEQ